MMNKFEKIVAKVAAELHEEWRKNYILENGNVPRIKPANDGTDREIDINVPYSQLTPHWQKENYEAACFVVKLLANYGDIDHNYLACQIHKAWLHRNPWAKGGKLDVDYWELPQEEKNKDLLHIRIAKRIIKQHNEEINIVLSEQQITILKEIQYLHDRELELCDLLLFENNSKVYQLLDAERINNIRKARELLQGLQEIVPEDEDVIEWQKNLQ